MPPVEEVAKLARFPGLKERYRVAGEGGVLGVGRCPYSLYKEILVTGHPDTRPDTAVNLQTFVDGSVSSLLEHCLGWRHEDQAEDGGRAGEAEAGHPLLRYLASAPRPAPRHLQLLAAQHGCPALALHTLLSCPAPAPALAEAAAALLEAGARLDARDPAGNTPLLCVARLLERGAWESAATLATMFCARPDCDVNSVNLQGRSLLSLSVAHLDDSIELTRVLINHGARVWPELEPAAAHPPSSCSDGAGLRTVAEITRDTETSAFTWLLRAVINQRGLDNTGRSVECLAHLMGRHPDRMKAHVTRVMLSEGRHPRVLGPVFLQLKVALAPFWTRPQHLSYLAWARVRTAIGPKRLARGAVSSAHLPLPPPMLKYLTLSHSPAAATVRKQKLK